MTDNIREYVFKILEENYGHIEVNALKELQDYCKTLIKQRDSEIIKEIEGLKKPKEPSVDLVEDLQDLEGAPMNERTIKEILRRSCDFRQNLVLDEVLSILQDKGE